MRHFIRLTRNSGKKKSESGGFRPQDVQNRTGGKKVVLFFDKSAGEKKERMRSGGEGADALENRK